MSKRIWAPDTIVERNGTDTGWFTTHWVTPGHDRVGFVTYDAGGPVLAAADAGSQHGDRGDRHVVGSADVSLAEAGGVPHALARYRHGGCADTESAEGDSCAQDRAHRNAAE